MRHRWFHVERQRPGDGRFSKMTSRLRSASTSGRVAFHVSSGVMFSGCPTPNPRNKNTWPPGRVKACKVERTRVSIRTARTVTRSCVSCMSGLASSSSNRAVTTSAPTRSSARTASRRNTDFRVFASTRTSRTPGMVSAKGRAGDPPPLPTSSILTTPAGIWRAATSGSMSSRSMDSGVVSDRFRPVRLIFVFQEASRR